MSKEKRLNVPSDITTRATAVAETLLDRLKDDIWPQNDSASEIYRAKALQRVLLSGGAIAVFAYIHSHREELGEFSANINQQFRDFKVGVTTRSHKLMELGGEVRANRSLDKSGDGRSTLSITNIDSAMLDRVDMDAMEEAVASQTE